MVFRQGSEWSWNVIVALDREAFVSSHRPQRRSERFLQCLHQRVHRRVHFFVRQCSCRVSEAQAHRDALLALADLASAERCDEVHLLQPRRVRCCDLMRDGASRCGLAHDE